MRILRWENDPELPGSVLNVTTSVLKKRKAEEVSLKRGRCHPTGIKDRGRGHEPKNRRKAAPEARKGGETHQILPSTSGKSEALPAS